LQVLGIGSRETTFDAGGFEGATSCHLRGKFVPSSKRLGPNSSKSWRRGRVVDGVVDEMRFLDT